MSSFTLFLTANLAGFIIGSLNRVTVLWRVRVVRHYRIYFLDSGGHVSRPPVVNECDSDQEASEKARQYIDGHDIEVWRGEYLVAQFPHTK